ncbi:MAG: hypothetical protein NXI04_29855 [Planctomycetaceae bacterium]|nr:hypothetical protein [Planctomycetaceae bacterium]
MWSYHHHAGLSVLLCDKVTHQLRTVHIDDRPEFFDHSKTEDELDAVFEDVITKTVAQEARENEYHVNVVPFALAKGGKTTLRCPRCATLLHWRATGIS